MIPEMKYFKITAIIRNGQLEPVEARLREIQVKGVSVTPVKGFGAYANFFDPGWLSSHSRIEIFLSEPDVEPTVNAILETAHTGNPGDGIVAVLPVETVYRIRTRKVAQPGEI